MWRGESTWYLVEVVFCSLKFSQLVALKIKMKEMLRRIKSIWKNKKWMNYIAVLWCSRTSRRPVNISDGRNLKWDQLGWLYIFHEPQSGAKTGVQSRTTVGALPNKHHALRACQEIWRCKQRIIYNPHYLLELTVEIIWVKWE